MAQPKAKFKNTKPKHLKALALCTETSTLFSGDYTSGFTLDAVGTKRKSQKIATSILYSLLSGNVSSHYEMALPYCPLVIDFDLGRSIDLEALAKANAYMEASTSMTHEEFSNDKVQAKVMALLVKEQSTNIKVIVLSALLSITDKKDRKKAFKLFKKSLALSLDVRDELMSA